MPIPSICSRKSGIESNPKAQELAFQMMFLHIMISTPAMIYRFGL